MLQLLCAIANYSEVYLLLSCIVLLVVFVFIMNGLKSSTVKINRHDAEPADVGYSAERRNHKQPRKIFVT